MRRSAEKAFLFVLKLGAILCFMYIMMYRSKAGYTMIFGDSTRVKFKTSAAPILPGFAGDARACVQEARRNRVKEVCLSGRMPPPVRPDLYPHGRLLVDTQHQVVYCSMPKVGTSTYMGLLLNASSWYQNNPSVQTQIHDDPGKAHRPDILRQAGIKKLLEFNKTEIKNILKFYTKFIVVRHPLERLASAYLDKMVREQNSEYREKQKHVAENYGGQKSSSKEYHVTFEAFAAMLVNGERDSMSTHNEHWMEFTNLCAPCFVQYDYIVAMETISADTSYILSLLFNDSQVQSVPKINAVLSSKAKRLELFQKLDGKTLSKIVDRYKVDMEMFGYSWNKTSFQLQDANC